MVEMPSLCLPTMDCQPLIVTSGADLRWSAWFEDLFDDVSDTRIQYSTSLLRICKDSRTRGSVQTIPQGVPCPELLKQY